MGDFSPMQSVFVTAIFTLVGFLTAFAVFSNAPSVWTGSTIAAMAAGIGGGLGWGLICGCQSRPSWWRTVFAGVFAGVVLHPTYLLLQCGFTGELLAWSEFVTGSLFLLLVAGIITVPAGVAAAVACRIAGRWWNPSLAEQTLAP